MSLYKLRVEKEPVKIYSRVPDDIIDLVKYYYNQVAEANQFDDPEVGNWAKRVPTIDDIEKVEKGVILYHVGMININPKYGDEKVFSEIMKVTEDFEIKVSPESVITFDGHRKMLPSSKRKELYKFQIPGIFAGLNFIPEDVMKAVLEYDLTPHIENSKRIRERISEVKSGHPNVG